MTTFIRIVVGLLLLAHGLVHLLYLVKEPDDQRWPFRLVSWIVPASASRTVAILLMSATAFGFGLLALGVWGVPGLAGTWPAIGIAASVVSIALLVLFWDSQLVFGVAISLAVIVLASIRPEWTDVIGA